MKATGDISFKISTVVQLGFYTHDIGGILDLKYLGQKCIKLDNQGQF